MIKYIIFIIVVSVTSCNRDKDPSLDRSSSLAAAKNIYTEITIYKSIEGDYPRNIDDLKGYYYSRQTTWDNYIDNRWKYTIPDPSQETQVILSDYKYGIYVEVHYIDGVMKLTKIGK